MHSKLIALIALAILPVVWSLHCYTCGGPSCEDPTSLPNQPAMCHESEKMCIKQYRGSLGLIRSCAQTCEGSEGGEIDGEPYGTWCCKEDMGEGEGCNRGGILGLSLILTLFLRRA